MVRRLLVVTAALGIVILSSVASFGIAIVVVGVVGLVAAVAHRAQQVMVRPDARRPMIASGVLVGLWVTATVVPHGAWDLGLLALGLPGLLLALPLYLCVAVVAPAALDLPYVDYGLVTAMAGVYWVVNAAILGTLLRRDAPRPRPA